VRKRAEKADLIGVAYASRPLAQTTNELPVSEVVHNLPRPPHNFAGVEFLVTLFLQLIVELAGLI
jgi:hypothetical protein